MPADHAYDQTHPLTIGGEKYGCNGPSKRKARYWAPHRRHFPDGSFEVMAARVPDNGSALCRYDLRAGDPKCAGCPRESDMEYLNRMKEMK